MRAGVSSSRWGAVAEMIRVAVKSSAPPAAQAYRRIRRLGRNRRRHVGLDQYIARLERHKLDRPHHRDSHRSVTATLIPQLVFIQKRRDLRRPDRSSSSRQVSGSSPTVPEDDLPARIDQSKTMPARQLKSCRTTSAPTADVRVCRATARAGPLHRLGAAGPYTDSTVAESVRHTPAGALSGLADKQSLRGQKFVQHRRQRKTNRNAGPALPAGPVRATYSRPCRAAIELHRRIGMGNAKVRKLYLTSTGNQDIRRAKYRDGSNAAVCRSDRAARVRHDSACRSSRTMNSAAAAEKRWPRRRAVAKAAASHRRGRTPSPGSTRHPAPPDPWFAQCPDAEVATGARLRQTAARAARERGVSSNAAA